MARSTSTALFIIVMILTFPIWVGLAGGLFGLVMGLFGGFVGIIAGIFGAIVGVIGAVFGGIFGIFNIQDNWPFIFHFSTFKFLLIVAIVFAVVMLSRPQKKSIK